MVARADPRTAFLRRLRRAAPRAIGALERELGIERAAAAETLAAAAALALAGLARHQRRRPLVGNAAFQVVRKYGRPADLGAPEIGIVAHLARPGLSPRLGGLLGDSGERAAAWLAARHPQVPPERIGQAIAAVAPLVLGAIQEAVEAPHLVEWLARVPDGPLEDPGALLAASGDASDAFLELRRAGHGWWKRVLGLGG